MCPENADYFFVYYQRARHSNQLITSVRRTTRCRAKKRVILELSQEELVRSLNQRLGPKLAILRFQVEASASIYILWIEVDALPWIYHHNTATSIGVLIDREEPLQENVLVWPHIDFALLTEPVFHSCKHFCEVFQVLGHHV